MAKSKLKYVIIRAQGAGVFAGELVSKKGTEVTLKNSRRLWYWSGAYDQATHALHQLRIKADARRVG